MTTATYINPSTFGRVKYYHTHTDLDGTEVRLRIYQRDYTGGSTEMAALRALRLEVQGSGEDVAAPIVKTSLTFVLLDDEERGTDSEGRKHGGWREFYTPDATLYYVTVERKPAGGSYALLWAGYITPDSWSEGLAADTDVAVTVRDNIGHLQDFPFDLTGNADGLASVEAIVTGAMQKITFPMTLKYSKTAEGDAAALTAGGTGLWDAMLNVSQFEGQDWGAVLEKVLGDLGMVLRFVGGGAYWCGPLRNLTLQGGTSLITGQQVLTFLNGGTRSIDPAYKQIVESLAYETNDTKQYDPLKGLDGLTSASDSNFYIVLGTPVTVQAAPAFTLTGGTTGWADGSYGKGFLNPDAFGRSYSGSEDFIYYVHRAAFLTANAADSVSSPGNTDPYITTGQSYAFGCRHRSLHFVFNLRPYAATLDDPSQASTTLVEMTNWTLRTVKYRVEATVGSTTHYWTEEGWSSTRPDKPFTAYYQDGNNTTDFAPKLDVEIEDDGTLEGFGTVRVVFDKIYFGAVNTQWLGTQRGVYACVYGIEVHNTSALVGGNRVTTVNDEKYNVTLDRTPDIGALSLDRGCVDNYTYENVLYRYDSGVAVPWGYDAQWSDQSAALPFPVQMHLSLLCYHFTGMEVLEGDCIPEGRGMFPFGTVYGYREKGGTGAMARFLLVGGTLDLSTGRMQGAMFHTFVEYLETWGANPDPDYVVNEGAAGNTSGTQGGYSGGAAAAIAGGGGSGARRLSQLSDVSLDDLAAGQMLKYNATSELWENADTLLELVNIGTAASPVYAVHVKSSLSDGKTVTGFYSDGFVSAGGVSSGSGGSAALSDNGDDTYDLTVGSVTADALATKDYVDAVAGGGGVSASLAVNGTYANCYDLTVDGTTATALATRDYVQAQGYITSYVNNYLSGVSASGTTITFSRQGLSALTLTLAASNIPALAISGVTGLQSALDAKAADSGVVHLAGTETITGAKTFTGQLSMTQYHSNFPGHLYHNLYESERTVYEHFYPDGTASGDAATVAHLRVWNGTGITALILNGSDGTLKWNGNNILFAGAVGSASLPVYSTSSGLAAITSLALGNGAISGGNGSFGGTLAVTGVTTLSSYLKVTGNRIYVGTSENNSHYIEYANGAFHVVGNLYADGYVSAGGQSSGGGGGSITVDSALSSTSTNPVQNAVIYAAIGDIETLINAL